jgi:Protein of unknown function (DUF3300)
MKRLFPFICGLWLSCFCLTPKGAAQSIPPGTEIRVQLLDRLDTGKTQAGDQFSATLAEPVQMDNGAVWPEGTEVRGIVVDVVSSGRLRRPASITLQLTQIGESPIETRTEQIDGKSHAGRNVALIGGGATIGAIVGAIAGGGKGAAIGTAIGAGAGTATAAATGKQEIVLPAETALTFVVAGATAEVPAATQPDPEPSGASLPPDQDQGSDSYEPYTQEQLDNLVAPVALYPDPLLAQVLVAATFPDQIQDAAWWVRGNDPYRIDDQSWDVSVKAVAHYPSVLDMMNDRLDWTTALGQAYVYQSTDVLMSVQRLRNLAYENGNLITTPQQQVIVDRGYIQIVPARPRVIFVPVYDPGVIYARRVYRPGFGFGEFFSFGRGFVIGAWLNYDLDWGARRVIYNGWEGYRGGWRERSRPYIHITNVYVNNRYERVNVNREVLYRHVDYDNVRRYNSVHRDVTYENRARIESEHNWNQSRRPSPQSGWQHADQRPDDRGVGRGNEQGNRDQQPFRGDRRESSQPRNDTNAHDFKNQAPSNGDQTRWQHPNERATGRDNGRWNSFGAQDRQPIQQDSRPTQRPDGINANQRINHAPENIEPPQRQNPNQRPNNREAERGNEQGARSQRPASPVQPATTEPNSSRRASSMARDGGHPSGGNQARARQHQQEQNRHGGKNKDKDDGTHKN